MTEEDFLRVTNASAWRKTQPALPETDARTARLQRLIDAFDTHLRAGGDAAFDFVPVPVGRVYASNGVNGFVSAAWVCYDFTSESASDPSATPPPFLGIQDETIEGDIPAKSCLPGENVFTLDAHLRWLTSRVKGCSAKRDAQGVTFSSACPTRWSRSASPDGRVKRLAHVSTLARVSVSTAAFEKLTPSALEALVAHELGHYYRAHATAAWDDYDYFHRVDERGAPRKPTRDAALEPLGRELLALGSMMAFPAPRAGEHHPALVGMMAGVNTFLTENPATITAPCTQFQETYLRLAPLLWPYVTGAKVDDAGAQAWTDIDGRFTACAASVALTPAQMTTLLPYTMKDIDTAPFGTLADALPEVDARHRRQVGLFETAARERLGYYTVEQEADDFSVELLAHSGRDPRGSADLLLFQFAASVAAAEREATFLTEVGYSACLALRARGWRDAAGGWAFVPIADFNGAHHSLCYRIFNVDRELDAHGYIGAASR